MEPTSHDSRGDRAAGGWLESAKAAERRGELLEAVDIAQRGLEDYPDDVSLRYEVVLSLARAGSTEEARRRFREYGLERGTGEDVAALGARLEKDNALAGDGEEQRRAAARAASLYADVFATTGGYYPGINAATLRLIAGDPGGAADLAAEVLARMGERPEESYYEAATRAEAYLLRGDERSAVRALELASALNDGDLSALATTRRQLRLICDRRSVDPKLLSALSVPAVVHFCGHRVVPGEHRFDVNRERLIAERIREELATRRAGFGYGSLASGADLLFAEALLERGAELHAVLPFRQDEFVEFSVLPAGRSWVERFEAALAAATSVTYASDDEYLGDDLLFGYAAEVAMGLALLRARFLDSEPVQIAVWDGEPADGPAGTAADVAVWRGRGLPSLIVPLAPGADREEPEGDAWSGGGRVVRAVLFGDVRGFSKLGDAHIPSFVDRVLGELARVLDRQAERILYRNTWGDGLVVVLEDVVSAASLAIDLQEAMEQIDLATAGLPAHLALRLGCHVGPVFETVDPVLGARTFVGTEMNRTARIEPVTPPGSVYVTEPFAAQIALRGDPAFTCDYVGHMPAAKDFGRLRMYLLRRRRTQRVAR